MTPPPKQILLFSQSSIKIQKERNEKKEKSIDKGEKEKKTAEKTWRKLEQIFDEENIMPKFSFSTMDKIIIRLGGEVLSAEGSRRRYRLRKVVGDITGYANLVLHSVHGGDRRNNRISRLTLTLFRDLLERAGIQEEYRESRKFHR